MMADISESRVVAGRIHTPKKGESADCPKCGASMLTVIRCLNCPRRLQPIECPPDDLSICTDSYWLCPECGHDADKGADNG